VAGQGGWIAVQSALPRRHVGHLPGRGHVARLAVFPAPGRRTLQPFGIGAVHADAKHQALVARGAVPAVPIHGRVGVVADDVIQRSEEQLPCARTHQGQAEPAVRQPRRVGTRLQNLVAEVAMDALRRKALEQARIPRGRIARTHGRGVAGGTDTGAVRVLGQQVPTHLLLTVPIGAIAEAAEERIGRRACVGAGQPFRIDLAVAVPAIPLGRRIRPGSQPLVILTVRRRVRS
jgi:hypothetical protein